MLYVLVGDVYLMFVYIDLRSLYVIFRFAFYSFFLFFIFFLLFFFFLCGFLCVFFFFFQAEDGIRDADVTGVQTCALPILTRPSFSVFVRASWFIYPSINTLWVFASCMIAGTNPSDNFEKSTFMSYYLCRSEERRVGKECRSRWSRYH